MESDGLVDAFEREGGVGAVAGLVVGEGHVVQCAQLTVDVFGQGVVDEAQGLEGEVDASLRVAVAVDEGLLVEAVGAGAAQRVGRVGVLAGGGEKECQEQRCCNTFHAAKVRKVLQLQE